MRAHERHAFLQKLAFQALGKRVGEATRGGFKGLGSLFWGKPVKSPRNPYSAHAEALAKKRGQDFEGVHKFPRTSPKSPEGWKTVSKEEFQRQKKTGNFPAGHFETRAVGGGGEKTFHVRKMQYSPGSVAGVVQKHPGKIALTAGGTYLMWDPMTQTYKKHMRGLPSSGGGQGYYTPSEGY